MNANFSVLCTKNSTDFSTLKLACSYFTVANKLSYGRLFVIRFASIQILLVATPSLPWWFAELNAMAPEAVEYSDLKNHLGILEFLDRFSQSNLSQIFSSSEQGATVKIWVHFFLVRHLLLASKEIVSVAFSIFLIAFRQQKPRNSVWYDICHYTIFMPVIYASNFRYKTENTFQPFLYSCEYLVQS